MSPSGIEKKLFVSTNPTDPNSSCRKKVNKKIKRPTVPNCFGDVSGNKELFFMPHSIDRSITQSIILNNNRFNNKHCHVSYCKQLACGEILTVSIV